MKNDFRSFKGIKLEFRGKVELSNIKKGLKFKAFLTDMERKQLLDFIQGLETNDFVEFLYYCKELENSVRN